MFTGIITDVGRVLGVDRSGETRFTIGTAFDMSNVPLGASIACSGVCLTVVETGPDWFAVEASNETLSMTILGDWQEGTRVNLERALRMGDELGGHIVSGHVDGVCTVADIQPEGDSLRFTFEAPEALKRYVASKGSVALDGVSLTVNEVEDRRFGINIIPHTRDNTIFADYTPGRRVNMEIDMLARYVARLMEKE